MALVDTRWQMSTYTDDFGGTHNNIFFKIQSGAPALDKFYSKRSGSKCGSSTAFTPRHLICVFADGRQLKYPVPSVGRIDDIVRELKASNLDNLIPGEDASELICAHLVGEKWNNVLPASLGLSGIQFKTTPYDNIPKRGIKVTGTYSYVSDVDGIGLLTVGYQVEKEPTELASCQRYGMGELTEGKGICSTASLGIAPRHFIIQALRIIDTNLILPGGKEYGSVIRNAAVAIRTGALEGTYVPKKVYEAIAKCAYCLGWQGESVRNVHNYAGQNLV